MASENNLTKQLAILADVRKQYPSASHVYLRRTDMDDSIVDIPMYGAEQTLRNHPQWEVLMSSQQMDREVEQLFEDDGIQREAQTTLGDTTEEEQMHADEQVIRGLNDDTPPLPPKPSAKKPRKAKKSPVAKKTDETA